MEIFLTIKPTENNSTNVLDSMTDIVEETENNGHNQNGPLEPVKCRFDYPLQINDRGTCLRVREYIQEYDRDYPTLRYELCMNSQCNDRWFNSHMHGLMVFWLANMGFKLVVDIDKVIAYMKNKLIFFRLVLE